MTLAKFHLLEFIFAGPCGSCLFLLVFVVVVGWLIRWNNRQSGESASDGMGEPERATVLARRRSGSGAQSVLSEDLKAAGRIVDRLRYRELVDAADHDRLSSLLDRLDVLETRLGASGPEPVTELPRRSPSDHSATGPKPAAKKPASSSSPPASVSSDPAAPSSGSGQARSPVAARPKPLPKPRRGVGELMSAYMEERNMRWGELLAGMLIIGSSIALAIALGQTQMGRDRPYLVTAIGMALCAGIHFAGLYTLTKWKTHTTSRGMLTIASMLIPLVFLLTAHLAIKAGSVDLGFLLTGAVGLVLFGFTTSQAGRHLMLQSGRWLLPMAALVPGAGYLVATMFLQEKTNISGPALWGLLAFPVVGYLVSMGSQLAIASRWKRLTALRIQQVFRLQVVAGFTFAVTSIWILRHTVSTGDYGVLSLLLTVAALPATALGLLVSDRADPLRQVTLRMWGVAIAIGGAMTAVLSLGLAWHDPRLLIGVGLINFATWSILAWRIRFPLLHAPAIAALALSFDVAWQLAVGPWVEGQSLMLALLSEHSSAALTLLSAAAALVAWGVSRGERSADAKVIARSAAAVALSGLAIACLSGLVVSLRVEPRLASLVLGIDAIVLCTAAWFSCSRGEGSSNVRNWAWVSGVSVLVALVHLLGVSGNTGEISSLSNVLVWLRAHRVGWLLTALGVHSILLTVLSVTRVVRSVGTASRSQATVWSGLAWLATLPILLTIITIVFVEQDRLTPLAWQSLGVAIVWLVAAVIDRSGWRLVTAQLVTVLPLSLGVAAVCESLPEVALWGHQHLHAQLIAAGLWCLGWQALRRFVVPGVSDLAELARVRPAVDEVVGRIVALVVMVLAVIGTVPGLLAELRPEGAVSLSIEPVLLVPLWLQLGLAAVLLVLATRVSLWRALLPLVAVPASVVAVGVVGLGDSIVGEPIDQLANRPGIWCSLAVVGLVVGLGLKERRSALGLLLASGLVLAVPVLVSAGFGPDEAGGTGRVATVLTWSLCVLIVAVSVVCLWWSRRLLRARPAAVGSAERSIESVGVWADCTAPEFLRRTILSTAGLAIVSLVFSRAFSLSAASPLVPTDSSPVLMTVIGLVGPLVMLAAGLMVGAIGQGLATSQLAAAGLLGLATSIGVAVAGSLGDGTSDWIAPVLELLQWNAIVLGVFVATWFVAGRVRLGTDVLSKPAWQKVELAEKQGVSVLMGGLAMAGLLMFLADFGAGNPRGSVGAGGVEVFAVLGGWRSILVCGLAGMGVLVPAWMGRDRSELLSAGSLVGLLVVVSLASAIHMGHLPGGAVWGERTAFHVVQLGMLALLAVHVLLPRCESQLWRRCLVGLVVAFSIVLAPAARQLALSGSSPVVLSLWSAGPVFLLALLVGVLGHLRRSGSLAWRSTALVALGIVLARWAWLGTDILEWLRELVGMELTVLGVVAAWWLACEIRFQKRLGESFDTGGGVPGVARLVSLAGMVVLCVVVFRSALPPTGGLWLSSGAWHWSAWAVLTGLVIGSAWDRLSQGQVARLVFGSCVILAFLVLGELRLGAVEVDGDPYRVGVAVAVGCLVVCLGLGLALGMGYRDRLVSWAEAVSVPSPKNLAVGIDEWVPGTMFILSLASAALAVFGSLEFEETWHGVLTAGCLLVVAVSMIPAGTGISHESLSGSSSGSSRRLMRGWVLFLVVLSLVSARWSGSDIAASGLPLLHGTLRLLEMLAVSSALYGIVLVRLLPASNSWRSSVRLAGPLVAGSALLVTLSVLVMEASIGRVALAGQLTGWDIAVTASVLVGLIAALIAIAVLPDRDPLNLTERGRMVYVYAAEVLVLLLVVHKYFTLAGFLELLTENWPSTAIGLAMAGVVSGWWFERRGLTVLAEPLHTTGAFLPLLPALGVWAMGDQFPMESRAWLFLAMALMYTALAATRRQFGYSLAAAVFGNIALWVVFSNFDFDLVTHPQLWILPPALSILLSAQLFRERLPAEMLRAIRSGATAVILVTSTLEMFIGGFAAKPFQPFVLMVLSVLAALIGMGLRVRVFLYQGAAFLLVSIVAIVALIARQFEQQMVTWSMFGIVLGIALLWLFANVERRRALLDDVMKRFGDLDG